DRAFGAALHARDAGGIGVRIAHDVRNAAYGLRAGVVRLEVRVARLVVELAAGREPRRQGPGVVLALAEGRGLLGGVMEPAAEDAHHRPDADVAAEPEGLVLEAEDVRAVVVARGVHQAAVPRKADRVGGIAVVLSRHRVVAGARALEL